jgi:hypothetical protein
MTRIQLRRFGLIVALGGLFVLGGCSRFEDPATNDAQIQRNDGIAQTNEALITKVEPYIKTAPDGTLELTPSASEELGVDALAFAQQSISSYNAESPTATSSDGEMMPLGARVDKRYWWGLRWNITSDTANRLSNLLWGGAGVSAIAAALGCNVACAVVAGVLGIGAAAVGYCNAAGRGIYVYTAWVGTRWCRSQ